MYTNGSAAQWREQEGGKEGGAVGRGWSTNQQQGPLPGCSLVLPCIVVRVLLRKHHEAIQAKDVPALPRRSATTVAQRAAFRYCRTPKRAKQLRLFVCAEPSLRRLAAFVQTTTIMSACCHHPSPGYASPKVRADMAAAVVANHLRVGGIALPFCLMLSEELQVWHCSETRPDPWPGSSPRGVLRWSLADLGYLIAAISSCCVLAGALVL